MQPHQQVLAMGILWLVTLIILPFLFSTARRRARAEGVADGQRWQEGIRKHLVNQLEQQLAEKEAELAAAKKSYVHAMNARRDTIAELEARILSYTGMAVTKADYEKLRSTATTLRLAEQTLQALKSQPNAARAAEQAQAIDDLATRMHAHLRATPASAAVAK